MASAIPEWCVPTPLANWNWTQLFSLGIPPCLSSQVSGGWEHCPLESNLACLALDDSMGVLPHLCYGVGHLAAE
eukprot:scaffold152239_cov32-Tisochrysis_lutea.AAC.4